MVFLSLGTGTAYHQDSSIDFNPVTVMELSAAAGLSLVVHPHLAALDPDLGFTAALYDIGEF